MKTIYDFERKKDFLICVDSDGCAMDTMDCKHIQCFGPCMVEEWGLEQWAEPILARWNEINLYTMTRGINRFKGLAMALKEIDKKYCPVDGIDAFTAWTEVAPELSNHSVRAAALEEPGSCFVKALSWSIKVNKAIDAMPESEKKPFELVKEGLKTAHEFADVAIVSSANPEAVFEEWERCGLLDHVDVLCCQDVGSKEHCIKMLNFQGYAPGHVLMVGDAPGDLKAAERAGVYYYPILVRAEKQSWQELIEYGYQAFSSGNYAEYEQEKKQQFYKNLGADI